MREKDRLDFYFHWLSTLWNSVAGQILKILVIYTPNLESICQYEPISSEEDQLVIC